MLYVPLVLYIYLGAAEEWKDACANWGALVFRDGRTLWSLPASAREMISWRKLIALEAESESTQAQSQSGQPETASAARLSTLATPARAPASTAHSGQRYRQWPSASSATSVDPAMAQCSCASTVTGPACARGPEPVRHGGRHSERSTAWTRGPTPARHLARPVPQPLVS